MTIREQIMSCGLPAGAYTMEDFIRQARPAVFGCLNDSEKHAFIRLARREQEIYIEAMLKEMGIKIPALYE